jgi:hypothetical protein
MNANAAGKLLFELGRVPEGSDQTVMQTLHNLLADPNASGRQFRNEFFRLTNKPGIDNKVVSFIGLVGGKDDMLVMDRIQSRHLWDDGRYGGKNIYDGVKKGEGKGGLSAILGGPRGLLVTEALEDGLSPVVREAYEMVGRPEDASVGRMHWETWVIEGNQAVSHSTLESVRTGSQVAGAVTEGKPGTFSAGTTYRQTANGPITEYPLSDGTKVRMTPERQKEFEAYIKDKKNGIIPKDFKVTKAKDRPWFEMEGVNRSKLDETARQFENANADGSLKSGAPRPVTGGRTVSGRRGDFLRANRADRAARAGRTRADDIGATPGPYARTVAGDDAGLGLLTLTPSAKVLETYQYAGLNAPEVRQVNAADNAVAYNAEMKASLRNNPMAPQVEIKSPEDLASMRLFRTDAGSGFAIKPDGDIVAFFASPDEPAGGAYAMLQAAVEAGGRKLDAFNTYLPGIYETIGFRPVAKLKWNDEYAPPGWDKEVFKDFQNGEPDVAFFVYDPDYMGKNGVKDVPYVDEYDDAVAIQNAELRKVADRVDQVHGPAPRAPEAAPKAAPSATNELTLSMRQFKQEQPVQSIDDIYALAPRAQTQLVGTLNNLKQKYDIDVKNPGIKTRATTEEKMTRKSYDQVNELTDIVRSGIVVKNMDDVESIIQDLGQAYRVIDEGWNKTPTGFVDRKVMIQTPSGLVAEVQIWTPAMYEAKFAKGGQDLYTQARSATDPKVRADLEEQMRQVYGDALKADQGLAKLFGTEN